MVQAWYMDDAPGDPRQPHRPDPDRPVGLEQLRRLGVLYWKVRGPKARRACGRRRPPSNAHSPASSGGQLAAREPRYAAHAQQRGRGSVDAPGAWGGLLSLGSANGWSGPPARRLRVLRMLSSGLERLAVRSQRLGCAAHAQQWSLRGRRSASGAWGVLRMLSSGASGGRRSVSVAWGVLRMLSSRVGE